MTGNKSTGRIEMFNGKRIEKWHMPKQLRIDEGLAERLRRHAELHDRDLQHEVLHLIKIGLLEAERIDGMVAASRREVA